MKETIIGIDLGSTNSCVAVYSEGTARVLENAEGFRTTPSVVAFTKTGEILVGASAKRQAAVNPKNTIYTIKRLIGRKFEEVADYIKTLPYRVEKAVNGGCEVVIEINGEIKKYSPEQISAMILQKLKKDAEAKLGFTVLKAVITVPAYFGNEQRQATKDAGTIAGLEVLRVIAEPTSAAMAYGLEKDSDENILVMDLGGSTHDCSILSLGDKMFEVVATDGDINLGGDDWDKALINYFISDFKQANSIDLSTDSMALQRLKEEAEKCKIALSSSQQYEVNLPFITADASGPKHLNMTITRSKFEQLTQSLLDKVEAPTKRVIKDSKLDISEINKLVLVGGMTRTPSVQALAKEIMNGKEPCTGINPDESVAIGAAIQGAILAGEKGTEEILLLDVTPLNLNITVNGELAQPIIEKNTTIPCKKSQLCTTAVDNQLAVTIEITQGNRSLAKDNKQIGLFTLDGIAPAKRGIPQIEVTFDLDANGILKVSALDKGTNKEQHITISNSSNLSKEDIEKMKQEAEANAEKDKEIAEKISIRNRYENLIYATESIIDENKSILDSAFIDSTNTAIANAKEDIKNNDLNSSELKTKADEFEKILQDIATRAAMAKQQATATETSSKNENVKDAEFEEVINDESTDSNKN